MSHMLKQRALEAYVAERLSPASARRLERHLNVCSVCSQALPQVRAYAQLREEAAASDPAVLAWERLEAALFESSERPASEAAPRASEAKPAPSQPRPGGQAVRAQPRGARPGKWIALAWPVLAVAATLVIAWIGLRGAPDAQPERAAPIAAVTPQPAPAGVGHVTLVAGEAWLEQQGARTPLALASEVPAGARVITGQDAQLHVVLVHPGNAGQAPSGGTGFALGSNTSVRVAELRGGSVELLLEHGSLANQVHELAADQRYVVGFGALTARVRGTRFVVEQPPEDQSADARVSVHEGRVEVARGTQVLALLEPGQAYTSPARQQPEPSREHAVHAIDAQPAQLLADWGTLTLPPMAELRAWIIDGERIAPQAGLALRLPRGRAELGFEDARGQLRSITLDLRERDTRLEPGALAKLVAPKEARVGVLQPEQITQVIRAGVEPLRRCYERGLRVLPSLQGKLTLSVRVGTDGHVQRAEPHSHELPAEVARCISQEAMRLVFPRPEGGGAVSFDVPLNLRSR